MKSTYQKYRSTLARTDFLTFEKRTHWIIAQDGWEEVATAIENWLKKLSSAVSSGAAAQ